MARVDTIQSGKKNLGLDQLAAFQEILEISPTRFFEKNPELIGPTNLFQKNPDLIRPAHFLP